VKAANLI